MSIEFFQSGMGHKFYQSDVPKIANALESIAKSLEKLTEILSKEDNKPKE